MPRLQRRGAAARARIALAAIASRAGPDLERRRLDRRNDWFSPSWTAYTGPQHDELLGDGWPRRSTRRTSTAASASAPPASRRGAPFSMDLRLRRHDGQYRWMLDNGVPRFGADGAAIGYVGSCVDIHERKELEESLAERTQQLRLAERRQGQFLAMLSHELRNPLAPIANAASVLRTLESTNPILVRLREILERQVARMGHLIEELIDVTRAAQGQISLVREQVSIESVVQAAVATSHDKLTPPATASTSTFPTSACSSAATAAGSPRRSRT